MTDQIEIPDSFPAPGAVAGKRVVITGASRGLGALLAHAFSHAVSVHASRHVPNCPQGDNTCIFLLPRSYNRFAVTREINDGLLAPRFAPSTRGWVVSGAIVTGFTPFPASEGVEDSDDR